MSKKIICITTVLVLVFQMCTGACFAKTAEEYYDDENYCYMQIRVYDVVKSENGDITFKNYSTYTWDPVIDECVYVIDSDTQFGEIDGKMAEKLAEGRADRADFFVLKSERENKKEVHVVYMTGVSGGTANPHAIEQRAAFDRLAQLGIVTKNEDGLYDATKKMTRGEMAKLAVSCMGLTGLEKAKTDFCDVGEEHWASGYITAAQQLNLMKGNGDGTFGADDYITYEQAVATILRMLGYEVKGEQYGGYPDGYMKIASEIKLADELIFETEEFAVRNNVALMLSRALDTPLLVQTAYGSSPQYDVMDGTGGRALLTIYKTKFEK